MDGLCNSEYNPTPGFVEYEKVIEPVHYDCSGICNNLKQARFRYDRSLTIFNENTIKSVGVPALKPEESATIPSDRAYVAAVLKNNPGVLKARY